MRRDLKYLDALLFETKREINVLATTRRCKFLAISFGTATI
jgi:hypothetical protein